MISFISGRASSGKTYQVYNRIKTLAEQEKEIVLIVPEQFSFESEKAMLEILGEESFGFASVLPFSRIYEAVGRITGGICGKVLTNADRHILMNRAVSSLSGELKLWKRYTGSAAFASQMLSAIDEFRFAGINSDDLRKTAEDLKPCKLQSKLYDTALVADTYNALLGTSFLDPSDYMDKLCDMLDRCDFFKNKNVFFDGFKSFTGQQFKVIDKIVSTAQNIVFTFVDDKQDKREYSLISNVRKTKNRILRIAKQHGLFLDEDIFLPDPIYKSGDLSLLEKAVFTGDYSDKTPKNDLTVVCADTVYDEAEFVARTIKKLVREEGAVFSDFVIIARDTEMYEDALSVACKRNKVKVFIDKKTPLSAMPVSAAVINAIEFAKKPITKNIFDFYKSGIGGLSSDEVSLLESYVYIWNLRPSDFDKEWDMNPLGLTDRTDKNIQEDLKVLNELRIRAITPLRDFTKQYKGTPKQRARAIFDLLDSVNARKSLAILSGFYKEQGEPEYADILNQSYSQFISLLDSVVECFPDTDISKPVFFDAVKTVMSLNSVGVVPQTLDEAVFGSADRIRPARPKYAFILGVNQGIFPRINSTTGIFTNNDLSELKGLGLEISDRTLDNTIDEQLLFYVNLCCASNKVFISYTKSLPDNTAAFPSQYAVSIEDFGVKKAFEPCALCEDNLPETLDSAIVERYKRLNDNTGDSDLILSAIRGENCPDNYLVDEYNISAEDAKISPDTARKLYNGEISLSATKLETFSSCKFKFFCRYIANAGPAELADFSAMQRGTIIHYVLERIIDEFKEDVSNLTPDEISYYVDKYCEEYLDSVPGFRTVETERIKYVIFTLTRTLKEVVTRIAAEFSSSLFKPVGCEVKIGKNSPVSVVFKLDENCNIVLNGSVDRIDRYENNVRIVDYKSGSKHFYLPEILEGLNMQMLIYLYAVKQSGIYGDTPAGVLYSFAFRNKKNKPIFDGLILSDAKIVSAMEPDNNGEFIPKYSEKKPSSSFIDSKDFSYVLDFVNEKLKGVGRDILSGDISARPVISKGTPPCEYCEFATVCRISDSAKRTVEKLTNDDVIERIKAGDRNVGEID